MAWISIKDRLPDLHKEVLFCCCNEDSSGFSDVSIGVFEGYKTLGEAIVMETGDPGYWLPCTHWMPVPEPPESF